MFSIGDKMKFAVNTEKAVEAIAFIANERPRLSQKFFAKIFFYAEKWHLNEYGRPIVADTYIAMKQGPVPSAVRDIILEKWNWTEKPDNFDASIEMIDDSGLVKVVAKEGAEFTRLSNTDKAMLRRAIAVCADMSADELSTVSHQDRAWHETERDRPIDIEKMIDDDNPDRDSIIEYALESSFSGVI
jgi:uncharacterized phage-associated protein